MEADTFKKRWKPPNNKKSAQANQFMQFQNDEN